MFLKLAWCLITIPCVWGIRELLSNPDFELDQFQPGDGGWYPNGCDVTWSTESYTGKHSVKITKRVAVWGGLAYNVTLPPKKNYYFKTRIQLLNTHPGTMFSKVLVKATLYYNTGHTKHSTIGEVKFMEPNIWQVIGGDFTTSPDLKLIHLYVQVTGTDVNYLVDTATLHEIPTLSPNWRAEANATIEQIRKADINIRVLGSRASMKDLTVELDQKRHEFGFGTAVNAMYIVDNQHKAYQDFFYDNFEWAVLENKLKWKQMEWSEGHVNYDTALNAIDALLKHDIKIRAHNVFWGIEKNVPKWQQGMSGQVLWKEMERRIQEIIPRTKGKVEHWDVNNENVHGHFYEEGTGDANVTMWMFREIHKLDPEVKLFLNDFGVVKDSHATQYRLDQILATGLPIWITELDISEPVDDHKADLYEDVLRLYFSTPQIHGIMFWGFWDGKQSKPVASIATGSSVTPNAAGRRWQQLFKHDWRTVKEVRSLESGHATVRGFKGEYSLQLKKNGITLHEETVILDTGGANLTISLAGIGGTLHVSNILVG